ncbi:Hsp20/alpha crystallin family protein [Desulfohalobium retbaense]|uniref:Heat shock protein Hsp20 n=1 Tax=Desulfohalobium retbaense (strain ATCC 49708 / DSM 5692 / JCM 16813 / HR100) TaxID=485915 RepID=C8X0R5_DESRD|nr:Hsp20/alpha crystallin family protein [Desulfohalobium retbaense]ACV68012.1 heat shock protein Hsp20 [Desulfohalobium retbaense DSM 5692]
MSDTNVQEKELPRYRPATDIIEKEDGFHLLVDMPGVSKEQLTIDLNDNTLRVSGKSESLLASQERNLDQEFATAEYVRSFTLSDVIDQNGIQANLNNGVLDIHLPKVQKSEPKKIEIQSA